MLSDDYHSRCSHRRTKVPVEEHDVVFYVRLTKVIGKGKVQIYKQEIRIKVSKGAQKLHLCPLGHVSFLGVLPLTP